MIIIMKPGSTEADSDDVCRRVADFGFRTHLSRGEVRTIIGVVGDDRAKEQLLALQSLDAVEGVVRILQPFKLASREAHPESTQFKIRDVLQIGARNVQNFSLLKRVAECGKPVLLKRGMSTSIQEWLLSAEYVLAGGNPNVILCERGIRTFETSTRYTLDLNAIPVVKKLSHLPVVVDPSHGTGHW